MKKHILIVLFCIMTNLCSAQHLNFLGIPIDGTPQTFVSELKKKGFKEKFDSFNAKWLDGVFYDKKASVGVMFTPNKNLVFQIMVSFEPFISEDIAVNFRDKLLADLSKKYKAQYELFDEGLSKYENVYTIDVENGYLMVQIGYDIEEDKYTLSLSYSDNINANINRNSNIDDL